MTGTVWRPGEVRQTLPCVRCAATVELAVEEELPEAWVQLVLACSTVYVCPVCIAEHGGSRRACLRNAEDWHRDRGGCASCRGVTR